MSLCTLTAYRHFTGDSFNSDADVTNALAQAQQVLEDRTERLFETATRTETLRVRPDGRVYPTAYPVTAVSSPVTAVVDSPAILLTGIVYPSWIYPLYSQQLPITQVVTYTGGYATIPIGVQQLCAQIAQLILAPTMPIGAASPASTADLEGYSYPPLASLTEWPPSVVREIKRWRHIKTKLNLHQGDYMHYSRY